MKLAWDEIENAWLGDTWKHKNDDKNPSINQIMIGLQKESVLEFNLDQSHLSEAQTEHAAQAKENREEVWKALFAKIEHEYDLDEPIPEEVLWSMSNESHLVHTLV